MKRLAFALGCLLVGEQSLAAQQKCYNWWDAPAHVCDGTGFQGHVVRLPAWAPRPASIVKVRIFAQNDPFPPGSGGIWTVLLDPGGQYVAQSGYPGGQVGDWSRLIVLGALSVQFLAPTITTEVHSVPIVVDHNAGDLILVDVPCTGGATVRVGVNFCWVEP